MVELIEFVAAGASIFLARIPGTFPPVGCITWQRITGRIVKGLFLYGARFLLPLLCIIAAFIEPFGGIFVFLILLLAAEIMNIYFYPPFDAYAIALSSRRFLDRSFLRLSPTILPAKRRY